VPIRWVVWWSGRRATTWFVPAHELLKLTLADAIAAASGISASSVHTVPTLLLPQLGTPGWGHPQLEGREKVDGRECYVIDFDAGVGRTPRAWNSRMLTQVWVDTETYLVRRIRQEMSMDSSPTGPVRWVTVTSYRPDIDRRPPASAFRPDHPDPKTDPSVHVGRVSVGCCKSCEGPICSDCRALEGTPCAPSHVLANCSGKGGQRKCTPFPARR
jgi:hypothetical protein